MELVSVLIDAEKVLDDFNGKYGCIDNQTLCQWCHALVYDAISGVLHLPSCIILRLRAAITEAPQDPPVEVKP